WNLEIDHIVPYAKGGGNSLDNLRLLCAKHNILEAEHAYGKDFMKKYINKE
ncbi:HNH endonuclease, partial [bacterium]|nr:HNH endonuclease [bacterium]